MTAIEERDELAVALDRLREELRELESVVVAFSGGADSAFLAFVANETLGADRCTVVTAVSPSLASSEHADCAELASEWDLKWVEVETTELESLDYQRNDADRCFHCKTALMDVVEPIAADQGAVAILGVNLDDLDDHRPGQRAASERGAQFPLVDSGFKSFAVSTCGWASPIDKDGEYDDDIAPSQHPERVRVRLVTMLHNNKMGSAIHFKGKEEITYDTGNAQGSLRSALEIFNELVKALYSMPSTLQQS